MYIADLSIYLFSSWKAEEPHAKVKKIKPFKHLIS